MLTHKTMELAMALSAEFTERTGAKFSNGAAAAAAMQRQIISATNAAMNAVHQKDSPVLFEQALVKWLHSTADSMLYAGHLLAQEGVAYDRDFFGDADAAMSPLLLETHDQYNGLLVGDILDDDAAKELLELVHAANMTRDGAQTGGGVVTKGNGYVGPNLYPLAQRLAAQAKAALD